MNILVVDNDYGSRELYAALFESYGAKVVTVGSVQGALEILNSLMFDILICEIRFAGESVYPLLQKVRFIAQNSNKLTPILVTSTCPPTELSQHLSVKVEAYLLKPVSLDCLLHEVWNQVFWAGLAHPFGISELGYKNNRQDLVSLN
jgi:CheY-like chemotaxis protein